MAYNNIQDFATALMASARPNQFRVHIIFPVDALIQQTITSALKNLEGGGESFSSLNAYEQATFLTHIASLPSYNIQDIPVYYRGRQIHEAGEPEYEQWSCTIYNSSDFKIRTAIEAWSNYIHDPSIIKGQTLPRKYKSDILIEQLDRNNNTLRVYKLVNAYPLSTGRVELNFQEGTTLETFDINWVYDYFEVGNKSFLETSSLGSRIRAASEYLNSVTQSV